MEKKIMERERGREGGREGGKEREREGGGGRFLREFVRERIGEKE